MSFLDDAFSRIEQAAASVSRMAQQAFGQFLEFSWPPLDDVVDDLRGGEGKLDKSVPLALCRFAGRSEATELHIASLRGEFDLSGTWRCAVAMWTDRAEHGGKVIEGGKMVGQPMHILVACHGATRHIHGICTSFEPIPGQNVEDDRRSDFSEYLATLEDPLRHEALSISAFGSKEDRTFPEIVESCLEGFAGQKGGGIQWALETKSLSEPYPRREYVSQYGETTRDFVLGRCGAEGAWPAYHCAPETLTLHLRDSNPDLATPQPIPVAELNADKPFGANVSVIYDERQPKGTWGYASGFRASLARGSVPQVNICAMDPDDGVVRASQPSAKTHAYPLTQTVAFGPEGPVNSADAARAALLLGRRAEVDRAKFYLDTVGSVRLCPGDILHFDEQSKLDCSEKNLRVPYLVTKVKLEYNGPGPSVAGSGALGGGDYGLRLSCEMIRHETPYVMMSWPEPPKIVGPQYAYMHSEEPNGPAYQAGDRSKVRVSFSWQLPDGEGTAVTTSYAHVAVPAAQFQTSLRGQPNKDGQTGQMVIVEFLNGDRRNPIIVGVVHDGNHSAPFPNERYVTGWRTDFHTVKFDDKTKCATLRLAEQAFLHTDINLALSSGSALQLKSGQTIVLEAPTIEIKGSLRFCDNEGKGAILMQDGNVFIQGSSLNVVTDGSPQTAKKWTEGAGKPPVIKSPSRLSGCPAPDEPAPPPNRSLPAPKDTEGMTVASAQAGVPGVDAASVADAATASGPAEAVLGGANAVGAEAAVADSGGTFDGVVAWCQRRKDDLGAVLSVAGALSPIIPAAAVLGACGGAISLVASAPKIAAGVEEGWDYLAGSEGGVIPDGVDVADAEAALGDAEALAKSGMETAGEIREYAEKTGLPALAEEARAIQRLFGQEAKETVTSVAATEGMPSGVVGRANTLDEKLSVFEI